MVIQKGNMTIQLEENIDKLNTEIQELLKVKKLLIQSSSFKLLYGKTQAGEEKEFDSIRSRLEHSLNIAKISQRIVSEIYDNCATEEQKTTEIFLLNKKKELLYAEITSLAHDLGHAPFGHDGERTINHFMQDISDPKQINSILQKRIKCFGMDYELEQGHIGDDVTLSFEHNEQSALIFYELLRNGEIDLANINSNRIISAILSHSTTRVPECPNDLIAQVVRHTDKIEYRNMDFDELGKFIKPDVFKNSAFAQKPSADRISEVVNNLVTEAIKKGKIDDHMDSLKDLKQFRKNYENVIFFLDDGTKGLLTSENIVRNRLIVQKLLTYYYENPEQISTKYYSNVTPINSSVSKSIHSVYDTLPNEFTTRAEKAINFILSMDNAKIKRQYHKLVKQRIITGKGINPITQEEAKIIKSSQEKERIEQLRVQEFANSSQSHSPKEMRIIVKNRDKKFVRNMITPEGLIAMENTRTKIQEEAKLDLALCELMEQADLARKYKRKQEINPAVLDGIIGATPKPSKDEKARQVANTIKENWTKDAHLPVSPGEDEEGPGGR